MYRGQTPEQDFSYLHIDSIYLYCIIPVSNLYINLFVVFKFIIDFIWSSSANSSNCCFKQRGEIKIKTNNNFDFDTVLFCSDV
jgi:hypothetical protein